jgi:hypothetical protein
MLTFHSTTTMDFGSEEDLEAFVRQLPLEAYKINALLDGDEITDKEDESSAQAQSI